MKKVECKKLWRWVLRLRCRKCGRRETFYIRDKSDVPTHEINAWITGYGYSENYREIELCPTCASRMIYDVVTKKLIKY